MDAASDGARDAAIDAPLGPPLTVQVSKSGSDLHDGINMPVETLKRALEITAANPRVTAIVIGPGSYTMRSGESFPYQVPANLVIGGSGSTVLIGTGVETALMFNDAQLQDVTLENFKVGIEAAGNLRLKNIKIVNSATGIRGARTAKLRIDNLDIRGPSAACTTGIALEGELFATTFSTQNLAPALDANNPGPIDIAKGSIQGDIHCVRPAIDVVNASRPIALSDTQIEVGPLGVRLAAMAGLSPSAVPVSLINVVVRGMISNVKATGVSLQMTGGTISNSHVIGFEGHDGVFSFDGVLFAGNGVNEGDDIEGRGGVVIHGGADAPSTVVLRHCTVRQVQMTGVLVGAHVSADLGTSASPGNNTLSLLFGPGVALNLRGAVEQGLVNAVGNTWRADTQGSDSEGHYTAQLVEGPVAEVFTNNFALEAGWKLQL